MKSLSKLYILILLLLVSCTPVLRQELIDSALKNISPAEIKQQPELYVGKYFLLGGIIAETKMTSEGSLIEAMYQPVDSRGYLKGINTSHMRYLALFPKENGILDPLIFKRGREITFVGEFVELKEGKIEDLEYTYTYFKIIELYLWPEYKDYFIYYEPYPYWWDYPHWWYRPYYFPRRH
ncbi:MAG: Slp family lipoprotein [Nitrospirae bacterium]|jgi:outer membrane lipoprotein|nr:Slp family lipoprotein [Nitrospirota bacterium]